METQYISDRVLLNPRRGGVGQRRPGKRVIRSFEEPEVALPSTSDHQEEKPNASITATKVTAGTRTVLRTFQSFSDPVPLVAHSNRSAISFCSVLLCSALLCSALSCPVLSCHTRNIRLNCLSRHVLEGRQSMAIP